MKKRLFAIIALALCAVMCFASCGAAGAGKIRSCPAGDPQNGKLRCAGQ